MLPSALMYFPHLQAPFIPVPSENTVETSTDRLYPLSDLELNSPVEELVRMSLTEE